MFFRTKKEAPKADVGRSITGNFSTAVLRDIKDNFAIGDQVHLQPEYVKELDIKSIVVGFLVNKRVIYGNEDITWDEATQTLAFHSLDDNRGTSRVEEYGLLLPLESSEDRNMTYQRKEQLSRVGLFKRGNTITAMSATGGHRSASIEGQVTTYLRLKQGLFVNHEVAVLSLDPATFTVSERRKYQRLLTNVPATIRGIKGDRVFECLLIDFVEEAGHFVFDEPSATVILTEGKPVSLSLELVELDRRYRLEGIISKVEENKVVVKFRKIFKEGGYVPFSSLDGIEIKAMLQKLPNSRPG